MKCMSFFFLIISLVNLKDGLPVTEQGNVNTSEGEQSSEDSSIENLWNDQVQIFVKLNEYVFIKILNI